jgi:TonB family protein
MPDSRLLHFALAVSLALHALLLYAFPRILDTPARAATRSPQIVARLTEPERVNLPERKVRQAAKPTPKAPARPETAEPPMLGLRESLSPDQYRVLLIAEARRHKRYPPLARENEWQGDVLVAIAIDANGRASVALKAGSGHEVLDQQALDMFGQAARSVPVPLALRGREFALEVRASYGLED